MLTKDNISQEIRGVSLEVLTEESGAKKLAWEACQAQASEAEANEAVAHARLRELTEITAEGAKQVQRDKTQNDEEIYNNPACDIEALGVSIARKLGSLNLASDALQFCAEKVIPTLRIKTLEAAVRESRAAAEFVDSEWKVSAKRLVSAFQSVLEPNEGFAFVVSERQAKFEKLSVLHWEKYAFACSALASEVDRQKRIAEQLARTRGPVTRSNVFHA